VPPYTSDKKYMQMHTLVRICANDITYIPGLAYSLSRPLSMISQERQFKFVIGYSLCGTVRE